MRWAGLCLLATGTMVACVDDEYDLSKDIDMTVTVGGANLVIPASSTEPITLKKIFDLGDDEDQALKTAQAGNEFGLLEGDYYLHEKSEGKENSSSITVDPVTVDFEEKDHQTDQSLEFVNPNSFGLGINVPDLKEVVDLWSHFELKQDEVTGQLRELDWLELDIPMTLKLSFDKKTTVAQLYIQKDFSITFPEYVTIVSESADWKVTEGGNKVEASKEIPCGRAKGAELKVRIVKVDFEKFLQNENPLTPGTKNPDGTYNDDGRFYVDMRIHANGYMALYGEDFPASDPSVKVHVYVNAHMETASLYKVKGQVDPNFNVNIDPVDFVDIPDFLNDPETNIDLSNPRIFLTITNGAPVEMGINAVLKPLDENGDVMKKNGKDVVIAIGKENGTEELLIDAATTSMGDVYMSKTTVLELSRTGGVTRLGAKGIKIDNLSDLVARVPAKIKVEDVKPVAGVKPIILKLGKTYDVNTEYEIIAPLAFGEDLNFVYRDTLNGWQEDLDGFELSCVEVELTASNQIPMQMTLDAVPLDADGNELADVQVEVTGNIPAGNGQEAKENTLKIALTATGGTIRELDGLQLMVVGKSTPESAGKAINENQTLQIKGVKLRIKDGITLDLN